MNYIQIFQPRMRICKYVSMPPPPVSRRSSADMVDDPAKWMLLDKSCTVLLLGLCFFALPTLEYFTLLPVYRLLEFFKSCL